MKDMIFQIRSQGGSRIKILKNFVHHYLTNVKYHSAALAGIPFSTVPEAIYKEMFDQQFSPMIEKKRKSFVAVPIPEYIERFPQPLYYANALDKFGAESPSELSVEKDDLILVFENPFLHWFSCALKNTKTRGYLPRELLCIIDKQMAIVNQNSLPGKIELGAAAGEALLVLDSGPSEQPNHFHVLNWRGLEGFVERDRLTLEIT
jgi:hypothetical protein